MPQTLKIDFVSDVSLPLVRHRPPVRWSRADRVKGRGAGRAALPAVRTQPADGARGPGRGRAPDPEYGSTPAPQAQIRETIRQRGEAVGFTFRREGRGRIWNTFDAHRLLHWAGLKDAGKRHALKLRARAHHGRGEPGRRLRCWSRRRCRQGWTRHWPGDPGQRRFAAEVREQEQYYLNAGIHSVPAVFNDRHLVSGGQPVGVRAGDPPDRCGKA